MIRINKVLLIIIGILFISLVASEEINVTLIDPPNLSFTKNNTLFFYFNCSSNVPLKNATIFIWDSNENIFFTETKIIEGLSVQTNFNVSNLITDNYSWNVLVFDEENKSSFALENFSLIFDIEPPKVQFGVGTEQSSKKTNKNYIFINLSIEERHSGIKNITINLFNSTSLINSSNDSFFNFTNLTEGVYYYNATVFDNTENVNTTETRNITLDFTKPTVNLVSPSNGYDSSDDSIEFKCNTTDISLKNATLFIFNSNGEVYKTSTRTISGNSSEIEITISNIANGEYKWNFLVYDEAGNYNWASSNRSFSVNKEENEEETTSTTNSQISNNDEEEIAINYIGNLEEISSGYVGDISLNERLIMSFLKKNFTLFLNRVYLSENKADMTISSSYGIKKFNITYENLSFDLNNDNSLDLNVSLEKIYSSNRIKIRLKYIKPTNESNFSLTSPKKSLDNETKGFSIGNVKEEKASFIKKISSSINNKVLSPLKSFLKKIPSWFLISLGFLLAVFIGATIAYFYLKRKRMYFSSSTQKRKK